MNLQVKMTARQNQDLGQFPKRASRNQLYRIRPIRQYIKGPDFYRIRGTMSHFGRPLRATESGTFLPHAIPRGDPLYKTKGFWIPRSPDSRSVISKGMY